jgi:meckelin
MIYSHISTVISATVDQAAIRLKLWNQKHYLFGNQKTCHSLKYDYFESTSFTCKNCPDGFVVDKSEIDGFGNYIRCKCPLGSIPIEATDCITDFTGLCEMYTCSMCNSTGLAAYSDQSACVRCSNSSTLGLGDNNECSCNTGEVLVEASAYGDLLSEKVCAACPAGKIVVSEDTVIAGRFYSGNNYQCRSCPDPLMTMSVTGDVYGCTCPSGYSRTGVSSIGELECILTTKATAFIGQESLATQVEYGRTTGSTTTVTSLIMQHYFTKSAAHCKYYGSTSDNKYCQALANLCVLQLYDDASTACSTFEEIVTNRNNNFEHNIQNWLVGMPWLLFKQSQDVCFNLLITSKVKLNEYHMQYSLAVYTLNGTFVGYKELQTIFQYCTRLSPLSGEGGGAGADTRWQYFGSTKKLDYECNLNSLLDNEQYFYELYYYMHSSDKYLSVPIRISNIIYGDEQPNANLPTFLCDDTDLLVKRFFLSDIVSGISDSAEDPEVIRYASKITLETSISDSINGIIYSPVLSITYAESSTDTWSVGAHAENIGAYSVESRTTMEMENFESIFNGFFIAACVFCGLSFLLSYSNWAARNTRSFNGMGSSTQLDVNWLFNVLLLAGNSWVKIMFPFTLVICGYFFIFFKLQNTASMMLPPMDDVYEITSPYYGFICMLHILSIFQFCYVLVMVYRQCNSDIFFIDWEPNKSTSDKNKRDSKSIWRTILAANEWVEMQTMRKTNLNFTLIWVVFILGGMDLQYVATQQSNIDDLTPGTLNIVLRFANTTFWIGLCTFIQWFWNYLIYERYISEPPEQLFIDFCTIAKVSIIVLDEQYHGYYLHCRSPHQYAGNYLY